VKKMKPFRQDFVAQARADYSRRCLPLAARRTPDCQQWARLHRASFPQKSFRQAVHYFQSTDSPAKNFVLRWNLAGWKPQPLDALKYCVVHSPQNSQALSPPPKLSHCCSERYRFRRNSPLRAAAQTSPVSLFAYCSNSNSRD
jgi:hypothetical protein